MGRMKEQEPEFHHLPASSVNSLRPREASSMKTRAADFCTVNLLKRRLPFLIWLPSYTLKSAFHDCIAGFTVALTAIPQGIAYGAVAGLPVEVLFSIKISKHSFKYSIY